MWFISYNLLFMSNYLKKYKKIDLSDLDLFCSYNYLLEVLKKYDYKVKDFNVTKDCLDELRSGINYNLIFILEDMEKIDAISFLNKCKKIINFNSKVFVITEKKDINSKKILLDNGFNGVVIKPINKKKLEEILNS